MISLEDSEHNTKWNYTDLGLSGDCWRPLTVAGQLQPQQLESNHDHLRRIHMLTLFVVCLCGAALILFLLLCALLSNESVSALLRRKPTEKGIKGQFQFDLVSHHRDARDSINANTYPGHNGAPRASMACLAAAIPIVIVPDEMELVGTCGLISDRSLAGARGTASMSGVSRWRRPWKGAVSSVYPWRIYDKPCNLKNMPQIKLNTVFFT